MSSNNDGDDDYYKNASAPPESAPRPKSPPNTESIVATAASASAPPAGQNPLDAKPLVPTIRKENLQASYPPQSSSAATAATATTATGAAATTATTTTGAAAQATTWPGSGFFAPGAAAAGGGPPPTILYAFPKRESIFRDMFTLVEKPGQPSNPRGNPDASLLDVRTAFTGEGIAASDKFIRFMALAITIYMITIDCYVVYSEHPRAHYLAYFTHWTLVITFVYQLLAFLVLFCPSMLSQPPLPKTQPSVFVKFLWSLYTLTINLQCIDAVWFWLCFLLLQKSPDHGDLIPTKVGLIFRDITKHGGVGFLTWLDGTFLVGRIPIRLRQVFVVYFVMMCYIIWTVICAIIRSKISFEGQHWPIDIDLQSYIADLDEYYEDQNENAVGFYEVARAMTLIGWKETPLRACMAFLILMAVVVPVNFLLHFGISWLLVRRPIFGAAGGSGAAAAAANAKDDFRFQRMTDGGSGGGGAGATTDQYGKPTWAMSDEKLDASGNTSKTTTENYAAPIYGKTETEKSAAYANSTRSKTPPKQGGGGIGASLQALKDRAEYTIAKNKKKPQIF